MKKLGFSTLEFKFGLIFATFLVVVATSTSACSNGVDAPAETGESCMWSAECEGGLCLAEEYAGKSTGWIDGMCSAPCGNGCGKGEECADLGEGGLCLPSCASETDCRSNYICSNTFKVCVPNCNNTGLDCGEGYVCDTNGRCKIPSLTQQALGDSCDGDSACSSGVCFKEKTTSKHSKKATSSGWVGGMCTDVCTDACTGSCAILGDKEWCLPKCSKTADCRKGYVCNPDLAACLPKCGKDYSCGDGYECDADDGLCHIPTLSQNGLGDSCGDGGECTSGVCFSAQKDGKITGWSKGMCTDVCTKDCKGTCAVLGDKQWCLPSCKSNNDCRADYVCSDKNSASGSVCIPSCKKGFDCGDGFTCGDDGLCAVPTLAQKTLGAACGAGQDCTSGVCFKEKSSSGKLTGWKSGLCADVCSKDCGGSCMVLGDKQWCLPKCGKSADCRDGYVCNTSTSACIPDCNKEFACGAGYVCGKDGLCAVPSLKQQGLGEACASSGACTSGICFAEKIGGKKTGWAGGLCADVCTNSCGGSCVILGDKNWCLPTCAKTTDCRSGYVCNPTSSACMPNCNTGFGCGDGYTCGGDGLCQVPVAKLAAFGESCSQGADCNSAICFAETNNGKKTGWTGGMCTNVCTSSCTGSCAVLSGKKWCLPKCAKTADCRNSYVCNPGSSACMPDCNKGFDCGAGYTCGADGLCAVPDAKLAALGDACKAGTDCGSAICFTETSNGQKTGWTGGMCTDVCTNSCTGSCAVLGGKKWCLPKCAKTADCRSGYVCNPNTAACIPNCNNGFACGAGYQCGNDGQCSVAAAQLKGLGETCTSGLDCGSAICFKETNNGKKTGWIGGMCADVCTSKCTGSCAVLDGKKWCLPKCSSNANCRANYVCSPELSACLPKCSNPGFSCGDGFVCGAGGLCRVPTVTLKATGTACSTSGECSGGLCIREKTAQGTNTGWIGGTCSKGCSTTSNCSSGNKCTRLGSSNYCLTACSSNSQCRNKYVCNTTLGSCIPNCNNPGYSCGSTLQCKTDGQCGFVFGGGGGSSGGGSSGGGGFGGSSGGFGG